MEKSIGDARARMQLAAVELFAELGYDRTTAAQIAARAGVTERTFFRHFADKREILFDGEVAMRSTLSAAVAAAPAGLSPLEILFETFRVTIPMLESNRAYSKPRHDLIAATPALREREMAKLAALTNALAASLAERGVPAMPAALAASTGMAAFVQATMAWLDDPAVPLADRLESSFKALTTLLKADP